MGFRKDAYATCWEVTPKSNALTQVRLSISRKDKQTGEYIQDFSGYVAFIGSLAASKAAGLKEKDRIKLGDVDVSTSYDANKKITYTNYKCYNFDIASSDNASSSKSEAAAQGDTEAAEGSSDALPW